MFSMFINTLNEKRTVLSFLHCVAGAVGQIGLRSDHPQGPSPLPPDIPAQQYGWRSKSAEMEGPSLRGCLGISSPCRKTGEGHGTRQRGVACAVGRQKPVGFSIWCKAAQMNEEAPFQRN